MRRWAKALVIAVLTALVTMSAVPGFAMAADSVPGGTVADIGAVYGKVKTGVVAVVVNRPAAPGMLEERVEVGTGIIYSQEYVLTMANLVVGATRIRILHLSGRTEEINLTGNTVRVDDVTNLAVVKLGVPGLPVTLASSDEAVQGDDVILVAKPYGRLTDHLVSRGTVAGVWRQHVAGLQRTSWGGDLPMLQVDIALNNGSEGAPLLNGAGEVVGIAAGKLRLTGIERAAYAIPANTVRLVADELIRNGAVTRPWLGVKVEETEEAASGLPTDQGLTVVGLQSGTDAVGKVAVGDRITAIGSYAVSSVDDFNRAVAQLKTGDSVALTLKRGAATVQASVKVSTRPRLNLLPSASEAWFDLTLAQVGRALDYVELLGPKPALADVTGGYTAAVPGGRALLVTEFIAVALNQWRVPGRRLNVNEACVAAGAARGSLDTFFALSAPANGPYTAELVQGKQVIAGRPVAVNADLAALFTDLGTAATVGFRFPNTALSPIDPITLVVKSGGKTVAEFRWDLSKVR